MREMDKLMRDWDVFVSPAPGSASLLITNLTGHPAVCLPCGFSISGDAERAGATPAAGNHVHRRVVRRSVTLACRPRV